LCSFPNGPQQRVIWIDHDFLDLVFFVLAGALAGLVFFFAPAEKTLFQLAAYFGDEPTRRIVTSCNP
jgi:hypothetical protein